MRMLAAPTMAALSALYTATAHSLDPDFIAPVTLEVLESLRSPTALGAQSVEVHGIDAEGRPYGEVLEGVRWSDTPGLFRRAYGLRPCVEYDPGSEELPPMRFQIDAGQRLIDALDSLENASKGKVLWRLLEGRVVITGLPPTSSTASATLDQEVDLDLRAVTLGDALRALEVAFNLQSDEMPIIIAAVCNNLSVEKVHFTKLDTGALKIQGRTKMRNALLAALNATAQPQLRYTASQRIAHESGEIYLLIRVWTHPCRDAFESTLEREAFMEELQAQRTRSVSYQAAIDARRAAREAASAEDGAAAGR